jgi:Flp pilus assembly protein TadD
MAKRAAKKKPLKKGGQRPAGAGAKGGIPPSLPKDGGKRRWPVCLVLLALIIFPALVYWPLLGYGFINWDDPLNILDNPQIKRFSPEGVKEILLHSARISNYYIPLTFLSFSFDYALFGLDPGAFHRTSLVLHLLNTLLVFWVFHLLSRNLYLAFFGAALFSLHPLNVESVAWAAERKGLLAAFFLLLALGMYQRYRVQGSGKNYAGAVAFFFLSLLSKPVGLMLPFLLLVLDRFGGRPWSLRSGGEKIPFFAGSLIFGLLSLWGQESGGAMGTRPMAAAENFLAAVYSYFFYLGKFFFPVDLSAYYPYPDRFNPLYLIPALGLAAGIFYLRKSREPLFGLALFSLAVVPVLKLVPFGDFIAADRLIYFPSVGLCFLVAWGLARAFAPWKAVGGRKKIALFLVTAGLLGLLSGMTRERLKVWGDSEELWKSVLQLYPRVALAHVSLGYEYAARGKSEEAIREYQKALAINPRDAMTYSNLGMAYRRKGLLDAAVQAYRRAIDINPRYAPAYTNLGLAYEQKGMVDEALSYHLRAVEIDPASALARTNLGAAYMRKGMVDKAVEEHRKAISLDPSLALAHANLGAAYGQKGLLDEAIGELKQALLLDPRYAKAHYNLAVAYLLKNDRKLADYHFGRAAQLGHPATPETSQRTQP